MVKRSKKRKTNTSWLWSLVCPRKSVTYVDMWYFKRISNDNWRRSRLRVVSDLSENKKVGEYVAEIRDNSQSKAVSVEKQETSSVFCDSLIIVCWTCLNMKEITAVKSQLSSVEFHLRVKVSLFHVLNEELAFFLIQLLEMRIFFLFAGNEFFPQSWFTLVFSYTI